MERYRAFHAVAHEGSFSRAAGRLRRSQPSISQAVQALEEELGQKLFSKRHRGVELSEAGRALLDHVDRALLELETGQRKVRSIGLVADGKLTLAAGDTLSSHVLPEVVRSFRHGYPAVELTIVNRPSGAAARLVADGKADIALVTSPVRDRRFAATKLARLEDVLICPPGHPLARMRRPTPRALARHPLLVLDRGAYLRKFLDAQVIRPHRGSIAMELGSLQVIEHMVSAGLGVSIVPRYAVAEPMRSGRLHAASIFARSDFRRLSLVRLKRHQSPAIQAMSGLLVQTLDADRVL